MGLGHNKLPGALAPLAVRLQLGGRSKNYWHVPGLLDAAAWLVGNKSHRQRNHMDSWSVVLLRTVLGPGPEMSGSV